MKPYGLNTSKIVQIYFLIHTTFPGALLVLHVTRPRSFVTEPIHTNPGANKISRINDQLSLIIHNNHCSDEIVVIIPY